MARPDSQDRHQDRVLTRPAAAPAHDEGLARALGARVAALSWDDVPDAARHWARVGILDTVGVTLAGSREDAPRLVAGALDLTAGPSLLFGTTRRVGALDAAFVNGTAAHALDFDDCNNTMGGHPSAPVLSALFPLADGHGASGRDFVLAYVAGFEVETKLALAVNFHHYTKGWHPTSTLGTFGAAAACARLLGLDARGVAVALALAASFASGIKANFGTMAKPMHVGHSARNGLLAARLAQAGFTANDRAVFEHDQGFLDVFNGPGTYDAQRALDAWAAPLDIVRPGIAIKQYPCCGSTHPAIDALLNLLETRPVDPEDVERVDVWIHPRRLKHTDRPDPQSPLDAKFSLQYVIARALLDRAVGVDDFVDRRFAEARVQALLARIRVAPYDDTQFASANHFGGAVRITLRDGTAVSARVEQALGRTSDDPIPPERLQRKFALCAARVLRDDAIAPIAGAIASIETLPDVRALTGQLMAASLEQGKLN